jgi:hypothetical protein
MHVAFGGRAKKAKAKPLPRVSSILLLTGTNSHSLPSTCSASKNEGFLGHLISWLLAKISLIATHSTHANLCLLAALSHHPLLTSCGMTHLLLGAEMCK